MPPFTRTRITLAAALLAASMTAGAQPAGARISDGVVKIGVLTDLDGPYMDNVGPGSVVATEIAVEEFGGKVLGYPVQIIKANHRNKADVSSTTVREWFDRDQVDAVTEMGNSAVAMASMKIANEKHRISIVTGAGSERISNEDCMSTSLHWGYDSYSLAKVGTQSIVKNGAKTWYYVTADYAFGHALQNDGTHFIEEAGGKVLGSSAYPFPGTDFSSYMVKAVDSKANVVALASAGGDLLNAIKQGREFGLGGDKQKMVAMLMSIFDVHSVGLKNGGGMMFAENFYWDMDDLARKFSRKFFEKTKRMPTALQAAQYSATLNYLKAIEKAKSDDVDDVIKTLKTMPINDAFARHAKLRDDGKLSHDVYLVRVKTPQQSKAAWDYYDIVQTVPGEQAFRPLSESKCPLVKK
jgi:branched-chain amino acid transport system substrate-binding protein